MNFEFEQHTSEESLELYALGRLDEANTAILEEHLLICDQCRAQLDEADRYVHAMQLGAARLRKDQSIESLGSAVWGSILASFRSVFTKTTIGWMAVAVALFLAAVRIPHLSTSTANSRDPISITLVADRGETILAPANHVLDLKMDARGLTVGSSARVDVVNAQGRTIETLSGAEVADQIRVRTKEDLKAGSYYVRIYAPGSRELVREFGLNVK